MHATRLPELGPELANKAGNEEKKKEPRRPLHAFRSTGGEKETTSFGLHSFSFIFHFLSLPKPFSCCLPPPPQTIKLYFILPLQITSESRPKAGEFLCINPFRVAYYRRWITNDTRMRERVKEKKVLCHLRGIFQMRHRSLLRFFTSLSGTRH